MASNKHYEVDLHFLEVAEIEPTSFDELLRLADLPNTHNPFGHRIKRGMWVRDAGDKWLLDEIFKDFDYQSLGYGHEISEFRITFSFDSSVLLNELQQDRFLYSLSRHLSKSPWRHRRKGAGAYFRLGQLEEGSIKGDIYAGVVAVGAFVAAYPELKEGFHEILTDASFVTQQLSSALRASKLPEPSDEGNPYPSQNFVLREESSRKRPRPSRRFGEND